MRLVHNSDNHQPLARRVTPQWVTVADTCLWGDRLDAAMDADGNVDADPYGRVWVDCLRSPRTDLNAARYMLVVAQDGMTPMHVECSRGDLQRLALALLDAAQHAIPVELTRAGYEHAVAPWFESNDGGDVA